MTIIISICYFLAHSVQYLPTTWTEKIPDFVMVIINAVAAKHGSDKAAQTNMSGNKVD